MKKSALILIDIQRDYFPGGACELAGADAAAEAAETALEAARAHSLRVIHVQQRTPKDAGLPFLLRGTAGEAPDKRVLPSAGETVIEKLFPSAFQGTVLEQELRRDGIEELVVVGMMTHLCVASTVHSAFERGFSVTLLSDATATRALTGPLAVSAAELQQAQLAALAGVFAQVTPCPEWLSKLHAAA